MQPSSANSGAAPLSTDLRARQHAVHTVVDTANEQTDAVPGTVSDRSPINLWTQAIHSSWRGNGRRRLMPSPVYHGRTVLASTVFTDDVRFVGLAADGVRRCSAPYAVTANHGTVGRWFTGVSRKSLCCAAAVGV